MELERLTLPQLFRLLKIKDWLFVVGIGAGIYTLGAASAVWFPETNSDAAEEKSEDSIKLQNQVVQLEADLQAAKKKLEVANEQQAALAETAKTQKALVTSDSKRLSCIKVVLPTLISRLDDANEHVELAAGTFANHTLRATMITNWKSSMLPGIKEQIKLIDDYTEAHRSDC